MDARPSSTSSRPEPNGDVRPLDVRRLGTLPYGRAQALQERLVARRRAGVIPDTLLLLEHPHVITLGGSASPEHVLVDEADRKRLGIELVESGRGGDVTYHGPGQLVGYPILDLKPDRRDLHRYLRDLERALIDALQEWNLPGERIEGLTGVWTRGRKIAAIGIRVSSGWITSHGFALNVCTELDHFRRIVPCGLPNRPVTSMSKELNREVRVEEVAGSVSRAVAHVFGHRLKDA